MTVKWNGVNLLKTIAENEKSATRLYKAIAAEARIGESFLSSLLKTKRDTKKSTMRCWQNSKRKLKLKSSKVKQNMLTC